MMLKRKNAVEIRHSLPGRMRLKVRTIRFDKRRAKQLSEQFSQTEGVSGVRANPRAESLVIRYDSIVLSEKELLDMARIFFGEKTNPSTLQDEKNGKVAASRSSVKAALIRFIGLTALTAIVFVREVILKRPLSQGLFSPLGIITSIAALPLLQKGLESITQRRFTLESFLGGSIVTAVAVGEATAALEILWITSGAELLKTWITERSRRSIRDILQVTEKNTYILAKGVEVEIPVNEVRPRDVVVVHTGEKLSVDGFVTDGKALLDESPINGRAELTFRQSGERVFAGTFVRQGVIYVHAANVGDRTYLGRILRMVEDSLENKAPIEGVAEDLAARLIRIGFASTLITLLLTRSMWRAFTVMLVMACPCATILAASTAISAALSAAAKQHILIKGGRYLEEVGSANVVCFDKTGTLTTNTPELAELVNLSDMTDDKLLQIAFSAEKHNAHPVALAIKSEAEERNIEAIPHDVCDYTLGKGVRAEIRGAEILVGSEKLMETGFINLFAARRVIRKLRMQGLTIIFVAKDQKLLGVMGFANRNRPDIQEVIRYLRNDGIRDVVMITGDEQCTATELTRQLNMSECYYSVMPEDKSDIVNELKGNGHKVLMVGDGINDALALAEADIGVAMGAGGSEVAIEAADIALVKDDLRGVVYVRGLSRATMNVVHQNFWIATGSNIAGVILGAMGILSPVAAGLIHIVHTLGVLANSGRLLSYEAPLLSGKDLAVNSDEPEENGNNKILDFETVKKIA